ncbi:hypothetical protein GGX14DRAFT_467865 [Mycena pura]|uniref:Uncharacterized protein n=1 Tax=Mycena pura TaxID=153505 RepID=A0AAD6YAS5_9AGAR|nr:hypothetical protein GGX14DRAFT_467865 [Mycena pura]
MCPPGTDQTERGPPLWTLLAPKLQQQQPLPGSDVQDRLFYQQPSPQEFLRLGLQFNAFAKLARVAMSLADARIPALPSALDKPTPAPSPLEALAAELVDMITTRLSVDDQMALALCSTTLWCHVLYQVHAAYFQVQAPWAGTPVICTSTYLIDLPDAILKVVPEVSEQTKARDERIPTTRPRRRPRMAIARSWNWGAYSSFAKLEDIPSLEAQYGAAFDKHAAASGIPRHIQGLLRPVLNKISVERKHWKLRNLDAREIVRFQVTATDASGGVRTSVNGPCSWLTLDFVLIARICWTRPPYRYPGSEVSPAVEQMNRGVWAGHCFDVVEDLDGMADGEGWNDVTSKVEAEAELIMGELCGVRSSSELARTSKESPTVKISAMPTRKLTELQVR